MAGGGARGWGGWGRGIPLETNPFRLLRPLTEFVSKRFKCLRYSMYLCEINLDIPVTVQCL